MLSGRLCAENEEFEIAESLAVGCGATKGSRECEGWDDELSCTGVISYMMVVIVVVVRMRWGCGCGTEEE